MNAETSDRFFLLRLNPPRPTFPSDMTAAEGAVMRQHFGYWAELSSRRTAIVYGPVNDPNGTWGVAVIRVADEAAAHAIENRRSRDPRGAWISL
jgi:hypothetical protein